jgi:hypothetical protein
MTKTNTGKKFEKLTESIYKKLVVDSRFESVEHNVFLNGPEGPRQIDVLVTKTIGDIKFLTVIECKDYKDNITIETIDGFHSKLVDIKASKGIMVTRKGFSKKTFAKAKRLGITLCTAQEALSPKWKLDIDAPVRIKEIKLTYMDFNYLFNLIDPTTFPREIGLFVKGNNMLDIFKKMWNCGSLPININDENQIIDLISLPEFKDCYTLDILERKIQLTSLNTTITQEINNYETMLSNIEGIQKLNNLTEKHSDVFIHFPTIEILKKNLTPITTVEESKFTGLLFNIIVHHSAE